MARKSPFAGGTRQLAIRFPSSVLKDVEVFRGDFAAFSGLEVDTSSAIRVLVARALVSWKEGESCKPSGCLPGKSGNS